MVEEVVTHLGRTQKTDGHAWKSVIISLWITKEEAFGRHFKGEQSADTEPKNNAACMEKEGYVMVCTEWNNISISFRGHLKRMSMSRSI